MDETINGVTAFDAISEKRNGRRHTHKFKPLSKVEGQGKEAILWLGFPLSELEKASPGGTQHRGAFGFATEPVQFERVDEENHTRNTFAVSSPWINIR